MSGLIIRKLSGELPELACADLEHFLGGQSEPADGEHVVEVGLDPALAEDWRMEVRRQTQGWTVRLEGGDAAAVAVALYTFLERLGLRFEISGPVIPGQLGWSRLTSGVETGRPAVRRRGIRQHINFPMDISSYPLDEAKEYIRNLARMRFSHVTFHSYTGQWFEVDLPDRKVFAGGFFYDWRHELPDDPEARRCVRNQKVFCIPEIEDAFEQPAERSRRAMTWLRAVIQEAKKAGLYVQFSFEPRTFRTIDESLAACEAIAAAYPEIDRLELITAETGGWGEEDPEETVRSAAREAFGEWLVDDPALKRGMEDGRRELARYVRDLGHVIAVVERLSKQWAGRARPALSCGVYCAVPAYLRLSLCLMRKLVPPQIEFAILASHGSRGVAHNLREAELTPADWKRTMVYSWIEFDGLMFLQQNPVRGIRQLVEEADAAAGIGNVCGMAFNHWRTAENATCARYAAEATLKGPQAELPFYRERAAGLGIREPGLYAAAMMEIDDADGRATYDLPNSGFCAGWGGDTIGTLRWQLFDNAQRIEEQYEHARSLLGRCRGSTTAPSGQACLALLDNRLQCTVFYLRAIKRAAALTPLCARRDPATLSAAERREVLAICDDALARLDEYRQTFIQALPDRGAEGLLVSFCLNLPAHLRRVRKRYGEQGAVGRVAPSPQDGVPLPIVV